LEEQEGRTHLPRSKGGGDIAQIMYTHVSTCKNDKTKFKNKRTICSIIYGSQLCQTILIIRNNTCPYSKLEACLSLVLDVVNDFCAITYCVSSSPLFQSTV
jgi:hypothetical protein